MGLKNTGNGAKNRLRHEEIAEPGLSLELPELSLRVTLGMPRL